MQTMKLTSLFLVLAVICRAAAFSVIGLANTLSTAGTVLHCATGNPAACIHTAAKVATIVWPDPALIPEVKSSPRKCYGGGQFIPGGGRAPKGGICM